LGAAFLILDLDIPVLWTGVLSLPAEERLTTHGVAVQALERVPRIACMTDGLLAGIKTQAEGLAMLEERRRASLSRRHSPPADTPPAKPGKLAGLYALAIGFASLFWLLLRSGPKPSRLQYPCQQAAAGNVGLLLAPIAGASLLRWFRHLQSRARSGPSLWRSLVVPAICLAGILMGVAVFRQMRIAQGHAQAAATARHGAIGTLIAEAAYPAAARPPNPARYPLPPQTGSPGSG
jgi:hypothetical protein